MAQSAHEDDVALMRVFEKRFSPEYRVAFDAWLKTDPLTDESAPPGPAIMPEYKNDLVGKGREISAEAARRFEEGTESNHTAEKYVRDTVLFAMVLVLVAMAQRLKHRSARITLNAFAGLMLAYVLTSVATLPRLS
jgi:hypothetical protein